MSHESYMAESLLVLLIVLREGGREAEFPALCDRYLAGAEEAGAVKAALGAFEREVGQTAGILALRALAEPARRRVAEDVMDFARTDPLLAGHRDRLRIRVLDILDLGAETLPSKAVG